MPDLPDFNDLELRIRTGAGLAIIVEGTQGQDEWIYNRWFSSRARRVTFHAQDGWQAVVEAVEELSKRCPAIAIFGLIDRDFADDAEIARQIQPGSSGPIFRTPRYDVESYLLNPECWRATVAYVWERSGGPPSRWQTTAEVQTHIVDCYRRSLPASQYNRTIHVACSEFPEELRRLPPDRARYLHHPTAMNRDQMADRLAALARDARIPIDLSAIFLKHIAETDGADSAVWQVHVAGKLVLGELHRHLPIKPRGGQYDKEHYLQLYLDQCPSPPSELSDLIDWIERVAGARVDGV